MKPETVDEIFRRCDCAILRSDIRLVLRALEATTEQKALRAMEKELIQARLEVIRLRESVKDWIHDTSQEAARAGK